MQTNWEGHYLDGKTALRQRVTVRLLRTRLEIATESGFTTWWPFSEILQTQGFYEGQEIRLERGGPIPEVLLIRDPAFLTSLHRLAPEMAGRFHDPGGRRKRILLTALAALAVVGITATLYFWGIPGAVSIVVPRVPPSWEERLGRTVIEHLAPEGSHCTEQSRAQAIRQITTTLLAPLPDVPYTFRVVVVNNASLNALAAPGGHVVVFRGLLEQTRSADELAGVLAHEFQHILLRHATRALLRHASTSVLLAGLMGDMSGAMVYGLEGARILGELRYSRKDEEEADREGLRMLVAAGVNPSGMISFFETLRDEQAKGLMLPHYLSTHPSTDERVARLRSLVPLATTVTPRLLPGQDWRDIRRVCEVMGRRVR